MQHLMIRVTGLLGSDFEKNLKKIFERQKKHWKPKKTEISDLRSPKAKDY